MVTQTIVLLLYRSTSIMIVLPIQQDRPIMSIGTELPDLLPMILIMAETESVIPASLT